jgi:hypothetical protein
MKYIFNLTLTKNWSGTVEKITGSVDAIPYPPMPKPFTFKITKEIENMLYAVIGLPGGSASDVVNQELTIQVGDATPDTRVYSVDASQSEEFPCGVAGTVVQASLVDVDASGNRSEARAETFTVTDTIAPPQPGEFTMNVTRQD